MTNWHDRFRSAWYWYSSGDDNQLFAFNFDGRQQSYTTHEVRSGRLQSSRVHVYASNPEYVNNYYHKNPRGAP